MQRCLEREHAAARLLIGKVPQIAAHPHQRLLDAPGDDGTAQPGFGLWPHVERQVAQHHLRRVGAQEAAIELEHAGKARARRALGRVGAAPAQLQLGLEVRVAQQQARHLDGDQIARHAPAQAGFQPLQRHPGLFKYAGQIEVPVFEPQRSLPAVGGEAEVEVGTNDAGASGRVHVPTLRMAVHRRSSAGAQPDVAQAAAGTPGGRGPRLVGACGLACARSLGGAPLHLHLLHQAAGGGFAQPLVRERGQGQLQRQLAQHLRIEPLGLERKTGRGRGAAAGVLVAHIAARPHQPVGGAKAQPVGAQSGL